MESRSLSVQTMGPNSLQMSSNSSKNQGIQHVTPGPYHPESNGKVKSAMKVVKNLIWKARQTKEDLWKMITEYRNTPTIDLQSGPVQRFSNVARGKLSL